MKIAFLCKRRYMSKDVILDRYARLYEIPYQLARLGHEVRSYCLSYHGDIDGEWTHEAAPGSLHWEAHSPGCLYLPRLACYPYRLSRRLRAFAPDVLIGASDIPHAALAAWLSKRLRVPYAVDLYDNFEGFGQARIPGWVPLFRRAVRGADLVTTTSEQLAQLVRNEYRARGTIMAMPSTVDLSVFHPRDKAECRRELGLPENARLVGTAGGLYHAKGIGDLYAAWPLLAALQPELHLVLAGPIEPRFAPPVGPRVHYLEALKHQSVAKLFAALDIGVICIRDTAFGRYCFPQKACEMLACRLPVVAANIGAMADLLQDETDCLYNSGDAPDLAGKIDAQLGSPTQPDLHIDDWQTVIARLNSALQSLVNP